jgi:hypothetical protein
VLAATGCSGRKLPPAADPGRAKEALHEALEAWKKGASRDDLKSRTPPIYFNEPQWKQGTRLLKFEVEAGSEKPHGQALRYTVVLSLHTGSKETTRKVVYQINTDPQVVIVPAD